MKKTVCVCVTGREKRPEIGTSDEAQQKSDCVNNYKCFEKDDLQSKNMWGEK